MTIRKKVNEWLDERRARRARAIDRRIMNAINDVKRPQKTLLQIMLYNPNPKSWKIFGPQVLAVCAVVVPAAIYGLERFSIGIDPQKEQCLPWRIFLIDKHDTTPVRGKTFAFKSEYMAHFGRGIKVVDGIAGDDVAVTEQAVTVNGKTVGHGLMYAEKLGFTPSQLARSGKVPDGKVWLMGRTDNSFDSRYWNAIPVTSLIGRAYPIW